VAASTDAASKSRPVPWSLSLERAIVLLLLAAGTAWLGFELALRIRHEASGFYASDAPLFRAVGRGILNGLDPYVDLFENKPPGIFLVYAASFAWFGENQLHIALQIAASLVFALLPAALLWPDRGREDFWARFLVALAGGMLVSLYSARRAGELQVEPPGALFAVLFAVRLATQDRRSWLRTLECTLWLFLAVGLKEPFLLTAWAGAILLHGLGRTTARELVATAALTALAGVLALASIGLLAPAFQVYLPEMLGTHIHLYGPLWSRGLELRRLGDDLRSFSGGLLAMMALFLFARALEGARAGGLSALVRGVAETVLALVLATYAVGMGGQYYAHHMVFATPLWVAAVVWATRRERAPWLKRSLPWLCAACLLVSVTDHRRVNYEAQRRRFARALDRSRTVASEIDRILEQCGRDRYVFLGRNGHRPYAHTRHSPYGPAFAQYIFTLDPAYPALREGMLRSLDETLLVVEQRNRSLGPLNDEIEKRLRANFRTDEVPACAGSVVRAPGSVADYAFYFRQE
jgi:hypothetical protein